MDEHDHTSLDRHGNLFEPEIVLPAQFFTSLRGRAAHNGERRLLLAVLEDAISCFRKHLVAHDNRGRRLFREAQGWIMSDDREYPFSFENICDCLQLDAAYVRQGVRQWARLAASPVECGAVGGSGVHRPAVVPAAAGTVRVARTSADASCADRGRKTRTDRRQTSVAA